MGSNRPYILIIYLPRRYDEKKAKLQDFQGLYKGMIKKALRTVRHLLTPTRRVLSSSRHLPPVICYMYISLIGVCSLLCV